MNFPVSDNVIDFAVGQNELAVRHASLYSGPHILPNTLILQEMVPVLVVVVHGDQLDWFWAVFTAFAFVFRRRRFLSKTWRDKWT
jgi:hypothetical protein